MCLVPLWEVMYERKGFGQLRRQPLDQLMVHRSDIKTFLNRTAHIRPAIRRMLCIILGFVLEGFDMEYNLEGLRDIISGVTQCLPEQKPRFIHGLHTPGQITGSSVGNVCLINTRGASLLSVSFKGSTLYSSV